MIKVTVILLTYNHERFIAQALESVLAQQTDFPFEVIISEDYSTDRTREIALAYHQRDPALVRLSLSANNENTNHVFTRAWYAARGQYVAMLDGDDYWTSPHKLQRQASFLDGNPACVISFHQVRTLLSDGTYARRPYTSTSLATVTHLDDLLEDNYIAGCSAMIRRNSVREFPAWYYAAQFGDWPLYLLAAQNGAICFLPECMGIYRYHGGGLWNRLDRLQQLAATISFLRSIRRAFDPHRDRIVKRSIGRLEYDLAAAYLAAGRTSEAIGSALRSYAAAPGRRDVPQRRLTSLVRQMAAGRR